MKDGPLHRAVRKVVAEVGRDPELGAVEFGLAVVALVHLPGHVGPAEMLLAVPFVAHVAGGLGLEVALAEHRARTGLDRRGVHAPLGSLGLHVRGHGGGGAQRSKGGENREPSH